MTTTVSQDSIPSYAPLRANLNSTTNDPFRVGILIGPGFLPMDMVGVHAVFGFCPGVEIHLLWKNLELVEGFPNWLTKPTTAFNDCPETLDVLAVPMLAPETQNDPEVINFVAKAGGRARYLIGVCNGVLLLGAAGLLKGRSVTASLNALPLLPGLGVDNVVDPAEGYGVAVDGNIYTSIPSVGSFECALMIAKEAFGEEIAQLANLIIEYNPHPPLGPGTPSTAGKAITSKFEHILSGIMDEYAKGALPAYQKYK